MILSSYDVTVGRYLDRRPEVIIFGKLDTFYTLPKYGFDLSIIIILNI